MKNNLDLMTFMVENGSAKTLNSSQIVQLNELNTVYIFRGEQLNLFAQKKDENVRYFLGKITENQLLFSLDALLTAPAYELCIVPVSMVQMYQCSGDELNHFLEENPEIQPSCATHMNAWLELLMGFINYTPAEEEVTSISAKQTLVLEMQSLVALKNAFVWITIIDGELSLFARYLLKLSNGYYPLTSNTWLQPLYHSRVAAVDTLFLFKEKLWREALFNFSVSFVTVLADFIQSKEQEQAMLLINRSAVEKEHMELAFAQLNDIFMPQSIISILGKAKDPLQKALTLIGHFMKISFVFPRNSVGEGAIGKSMSERLDIICQASQIQKRKIKIEGCWWKHNHGSLLAFEVRDNEPVSIIRLDEYKLIDEHRNQYLNESIASQLSTTGYMFYRRLDPKLKKGREAVSFFYKNYYKELIKIIPISILGVFFALFPPVAIKLLFSQAIPQSDPSLILYLIFGLVFSAVGFSFFYLLQGFVYLKMEGLGAHLIQTAFWDRLLKLPVRFFQRFTVGNLFSRISSIEEIRKRLNTYGSSLAITLIFALLYFIMMLVYAPVLAVITLFFATLLTLATFICGRAKIKILNESLEIDANLRGVAMQMIQGIEKLRSAGVDKSAYSYWASSFARNNILKLKAKHIENFSTLAITLFPIVSTWFIYFTIVQWFPDDTLSLPDFLAFNIAFGSFTLAIYSLNTMLIQLADMIPLWDRTQVILEEPMEAQEHLTRLERLSGDIRIDNLIFGYNPAHPPIINNISLTIKPRQFVGIVGKTGCGKSTLIRLLLGFEKASSGSIFFDGIDIASLDLQAVRRQMGVVLQSGGIMGGSIYEILSSGSTYSQQEFDKALQFSGFDKDLESLPMGYNTVVPLNATTLSGGQKQRLLLARALMGNPSILIFDEATSSLDNTSQKQIVRNIESLNVTRIAIAQRLSTIRDADVIYVVDKGCIVQTGTYDELAQQSGIFSEMLAKQK